MLNLGKAFDLDFMGDTDLEIETLTVPLQLVVRNLLNNAITFFNRSWLGIHGCSDGVPTGPSHSLPKNQAFG